ncbi:MAG: hypothetical protein V5B36_05480 [Candidatus Accumulibacter sp. UW25]|jgi:hypothetical protein
MSSSASDSASQFKEKAQQLYDCGKVQESYFILENAISRYPSDLSIVYSYLSFLQNVGENEPIATQLEGFDRSIALLLNCLTHIALGEVDSVVNMIDDFRSKREKLISLLSNNENTFDEQHHLWLNAVADSFREDFPTDDRSLERLICDIEAFQEIIPESMAGSSPATRLDTYLKRARLAREFDAVKMDVDNRLSKHCLSKDSTLAPYSLQHLETLLRGFSVDSENLDKGRVYKLKNLIEKLRETSDHVASSIKKREAKIKWKDYQTTYKNDLDRYSRGVNIVRGYGPQIFADQVIETNMATIRRLMQSAQEVIPVTIGTPSAKDVYEELTKLSSLIVQMAAEQQKKYERWAIGRIKSGYIIGSEHAGMIDDEKKIAQSLIDHFGEIDIRLLGHESQLIYSEVFSLLFERLDKPSRNATKDFKSESNKLYTLEQMMLKSKKCLSDF